ncbi:hypothetical protein NLJ89_g2956 [Agrocybe chaxingu]|uniref:Protein prenyltransferase alpha subunit repeat-containing protein 1 n=1 Tax=Agrocybe chaxingu TaxID=84603 RepID=A0A9W8MYP0_9AGAR|nr:hypothetical protein NLJ89_g2956 [Agrocybe chaxingu]
MDSLNHCVDLVYELFATLKGLPASIEILPGGLEEWERFELPSDAPTPCATFPFVFVEGNLGIPKTILHALYMAAMSTPWRSSNSTLDKLTAEKSNAATLVILLVNPAHQTALNHRKRLIQEGHIEAEKELALFELLSRGSPEVGKASMIWHHRRWCFCRVYDVFTATTSEPACRSRNKSPSSTEQYWPWPKSEPGMESLPKIPPSTVRRELKLIQHTCETYPRNYHAWAHWHFIMNVCFTSFLVSLSRSHNDFPDDKRDSEFLATIIEEYARLRHWVELHVSDYSAMHQLRQCEKLVDHLVGAGHIAEESLIKQLPLSGLVDHSLSLLASYPEHESIWMYLRMSLESSSSETRSAVLEDITSRFSSTYPVYTHHLISWFNRAHN